jgi:hypothetical protein
MKDIKLKIEFKDCWEFDTRLPEDHRWLACIDDLGIVVVASTKEKAFEEIMTSLMVKAMYDSNYEPREVGHFKFTPDSPF